MFNSLIGLLTVFGMSVIGAHPEGDYDEYGGWKLINGEKTGYFHVQQIDGVWWLIDPEGNVFLSKGVNHISFTADNAPTLGYSPYGRVTAEKYGNASSWAKQAIQNFWNWGFNTVGAWSHRETFVQKMPYTMILGLGSATGADWQKGSFPDVFSEKFRSAIEEKAKRLCAPVAEDPYLLGYFIDNELRWGPDWRSQKTLFDDFLAMPEHFAGKKTLVNMLREIYGSIEKANEVFGTNARSFDELPTPLSLSPAAMEVKKVKSIFLQRVAEQYFKVCAESIRESDPDHLILGCRFAGYAPKEVVLGMNGWVDVVSYNNYDFLPPEGKLDEIHQDTGKPIMLTEFSFKAMDSGLPNTKGAGRPVETQDDRARHFEQYVTKLMSLPYAVGFHWFEYADEPAEGRFDGENSNYGLVNIKDEPWEILIQKMSELNRRIESIHRGS